MNNVEPINPYVIEVFEVLFGTLKVVTYAMVWEREHPITEAAVEAEISYLVAINSCLRESIQSSGKAWQSYTGIQIIIPPQAS